MIRTQLQRILQVGRGKGVVDDDLGVASRLNNLRDCGDIRDRRRWVGWGLQPNELGVLFQRRLHRRGIGGIDDGQLDTPLAVVMMQEAIHAAVGIVAEDDVVTWTNKNPNEGIDGRHARGETAGILGILQRREGLLQRMNGGIGHAPVLIAAAQLRETILLVRGGGIDRYVDGSHVGIRLVTGMDGTGGKAKGAVVSHEAQV